MMHKEKTGIYYSKLPLSMAYGTKITLVINHENADNMSPSAQDIFSKTLIYGTVLRLDFQHGNLEDGSTRPLSYLDKNGHVWPWRR